MKLLAIDTSSNACSVAAEIDGQITEEHAVKPRQHTKILLPMIQAVLRQAEFTLPELDALILGNGPGSFIGIRIAASVAQGICLGTEVNIVPVSSLAAVAAEVFANSPAEHVIVAQDARMDEIYVGQYRRGENDAAVAIGDETILAVGRIETIVAGSVAAGMAWQSIPCLADDNIDKLKRIEKITVPRARYLLPAAHSVLRDGVGVPPGMLVPAYLRNKVAEPARLDK